MKLHDVMGRLDTKTPGASWLSHTEKLAAEAESGGNSDYQRRENRTVNKRDGFAVTEIHLKQVKRPKP